MGSERERGRTVVHFELLDGVVEDGERAVIVRVKLAKDDEVRKKRCVDQTKKTREAYFAMLR